MWWHARACLSDSLSSQSQERAYLSGFMTASTGIAYAGADGSIQQVVIPQHSIWSCALLCRDCSTCTLADSAQEPYLVTCCPHRSHPLFLNACLARTRPSRRCLATAKTRAFSLWAEPSSRWWRLRTCNVLSKLWHGCWQER